jgi:hypothetical protein
VDIPELFQSTSVLVLPYDSATGSSGPAHQACEYGVPIVCANIRDFHGMVEDEDMAVRFYETGDPASLAKQLIAILQSPGLQRQMAQHNFAAGVEMTMTSVVRNYLRWFELNRCKKAVGDAGLLRDRRRRWLRSLRNRDGVPDSDLPMGLLSPRLEHRKGPEATTEYPPVEAFADPIAWRGPVSAKDHIHFEPDHSED